MKTERTYYGFQMGAPSFPGAMDSVTTRKPHCGYQVKTRASSLEEARKKLDEIWNRSCAQSLKGKKPCAS